MFLSRSGVSCMLEAASDKKVQVRWRQDQGSQPFEVFTDHIARFLLGYHLDTDLYNMAKNILAFKWPSDLYPYLNNADVTGALMHQACTLRVVTVWITARLSDSGLSWIATSSF